MKGTDKKLEKEKKWAYQPPLPEDIVSFLDRPSRAYPGWEEELFWTKVHYTSQLRKKDEQNNKHKRKILRNSFQFFSRTNGSLFIAVGYNKSISVA